MILSDRTARKSRSIIFAFTASPPPIYARFKQQTFAKSPNDYVNPVKHTKSLR